MEQDRELSDSSSRLAGEPLLTGTAREEFLRQASGEIARWQEGGSMHHALAVQLLQMTEDAVASQHRVLG
jgi:hypothetical protein